MSEIEEEKAKVAVLSYEFKRAWHDAATDVLGEEKGIELLKTIPEEQLAPLAGSGMINVLDLISFMADPTGDPPNPIYVREELLSCQEEDSDSVINLVAPLVRATFNFSDALTARCITDEMRESLDVLERHAPDLAQAVKKFPSPSVCN